MHFRVGFETQLLQLRSGRTRQIHARSLLDMEKGLKVYLNMNVLLMLTHIDNPVPLDIDSIW